MNDNFTENPIDVEFVDTDNVEIQEVDFEDERSVKQATDLLLQKELGEEVIEGEVEQEIVQEVDFEDEDSVKQATDMLLQKELGEEVIEGVVEQEIVQDEHDFKVIEPQDMIQAEEASMHVEQVEEVVETE